MNNLVTKDVNRLVLVTITETDLAEVLEKLRTRLRDMEIIQQPVNNQQHCYAVGDGFMQQIIFMGCSPAIELQIPDVMEAGKVNFTFVRLSQHAGEDGQYAVPYYGKRYDHIQQVPRCPACRRPVKADISQLHSSLRSDPDRITCHACQHSSDVADLDWRKQTGWGNVFIEILNVYPHEAVPTDGLLQALSETTTSNWKYFYTAHDFQS